MRSRLTRGAAGRAPATVAAFVSLATLVALSLAGCGGDGDRPATADRIAVVAGFYPLQFVAERLGGDHVTVTGLAQPGAEPHDLELKPSQLVAVADAHLVLYLKGFQPELDTAVEQNASGRSFDVTTVSPLERGEPHEHEGEAPHGEEESELDPHVWLDPTRLTTISDAVAARLGQVDPDDAASYTGRAKELRDELTKLDGEFKTGLATCQRREIFTSHTAFGYLARRYGLEQIGLTGLTPEAEPSPRRLAEVAAEAREHGATTIFFETLVSSRTADALAREVGAKAAVLDPLEGLPAGASGDYFSIMRANLAALRDALGCA